MKHTIGPWRWADWSADYGRVENGDIRRVLEYNPRHPGVLTPVMRCRDDDPLQILKIEDPEDINPDDAELIRRAPELAEALHEMLDMFGGNMDQADYDRFRMLAGER